MSNYPRDEFDNIPESSSRQGVHRTAMARPQTGLGPLLGFAAIALIIGLALFLLVPRLPGGEPRAGSASSASATATGAQPAEASPTEAVMPGDVPTAEPSVATTPPTSAAPPVPAVDRSQPVAVYNASGVTGLAAGAAQQLRAQGWTVSTTGNWQGAPQRASVVLYQSEQMRPNAEEIAATLNISAVSLSPQLAAPVLVILGPGAG